MVRPNTPRHYHSVKLQLKHQTNLNLWRFIKLLNDQQLPMILNSYILQQTDTWVFVLDSNFYHLFDKQWFIDALSWIFLYFFYIFYYFTANLFKFQLYILCFWLRFLFIPLFHLIVTGKFRHLPVVENGEVIALLDITKCLYDAISRMEKAAEQGSAIAAAVEGVERQWGSNFSGG